MNKKRQLIFRCAAILLVIALAVVMFVIGRGHTIYFDNKACEYGGKSYDAYYKVCHASLVLGKLCNLFLVLDNGHLIV